MRNPAPRAHLPAVRFSARAYMGCGAWDLAQAPELAVPSLESARRGPGGPRRLFLRPRRTLGCAGVSYGPEVDEETKLSCGGGGYQPDFMKDEDELSGPRRRVTMGCGDEPCEECKAKGVAQMGCLKCKRVRQRAMMNEELEGAHHLGQAPGLPDTSILVVSGLAVAGLFYLATR